MKSTSSTNRVKVDGAGSGEISDEMISRRARLTEANDSDLDNARGDFAAEEPDTLEKEAAAISEDDRPDSGVPPMRSGIQVPRLELEDEANFAEEEVEEGVAEADLDTRVKSRHRS